jgi:hypothetical protein
VLLWLPYLGLAILCAGGLLDSSVLAAVGAAVMFAVLAWVYIGEWWGR